VCSGSTVRAAKSVLSVEVQEGKKFSTDEEY